MGMQIKNALEFEGGNAPLAEAFVHIIHDGFALQLEPDIWSALQEICQRGNCNVGDVCQAVLRVQMNLSFLDHNMRSFVVNYFRDAATEDGHRMVSYGCL